MASGNTLAAFLPQQNEPPTSNPAAPDLRNNIPVLAFDTTTQEHCVFSGMMPNNYASGGLTFRLKWVAATATTGNGGWVIALERITGGQDIDADGFATGQTVATVTVPATAGVEALSTLAITHGTNTDSIVAGDRYRVKISRDVATDTAAGDLQLIGVEIRET